MSESWIIGYDITCPRRLGRIHRQMVNQATPLQYSIFLFEGTPEALERCLSTIEALIDPKTDDVRCYALPQRGLKISLGHAVLPDGIHWAGLPLPL